MVNSWFLDCGEMHIVETFFYPNSLIVANEKQLSSNTDAICPCILK